ncbi:MAG: hypothetical protein M9962_10750 [Oligoflexia bacterium]|nr:hypothetical protein [Oligoflexia bacterium]
MEKPVRIISTEKIRSFNDKVRNGLEHALNFMLATEDSKIEISQFEPFLMPVEAYLKAYKKKSIMIKIYCGRAYVGELYWFFELNSAIILGSLLRMLPISALEEKLRDPVFDATDQDAFGEVGNQLCGILDRAFRTLTKKDIHLKMDFNKAVYPDEALELKTFKNHEEYVVLLCDIKIPKQPTQKLTLLLPRSLYEVMLNIEISLEGIDPKLVLIHSQNEERMEQIQTSLNNRYTKVIAVSAVDEIITKIDQPRIAAVGIELPKLNFPLSVQDSILLKRLAANRALSKLPSFITWEGASIVNIEEVKKLGLAGVTEGSFSEDFARWVLAFTKN